MIRPPDPQLPESMLRLGRYSSAQAARMLAHCFFRDAHTALDLTFAAGGFWRRPLPPGLAVTSNNIDPSAKTDLHVDFTATGLPDGAYDLVTWDPPHLSDLGESALMRGRFGTVEGAGFRDMIDAGACEAWRLASVGIIVKVLDGPHGGRYQQLTRWVERVIPMPPVFEIHTVGRPTPRPKGEIARVPKNNGADWLIFRRDGKGGRYPDFVKAYARQEASRLAALSASKRCAMCDSPMGERRTDAATCSATCRQRASRQRRAS